MSDPGFYALLNNNRFIAGVAMILMNMGSRYLVTDVTEFQDHVMKSRAFKQTVLYCIFFVATRDLLTASMLWFAYNFIVNVLFNERQKYSITRFLSPKFSSSVYALMKNPRKK